MSALRDERGLRRVSGAEPQVVGLAPQTTMNDRKANTMKTYILRDPNTVEPQKQQPKPQTPDPRPEQDNARDNFLKQRQVPGQAKRLMVV